MHCTQKAKEYQKKKLWDNQNELANDQTKIAIL